MAHAADVGGVCLRSIRLRSPNCRALPSLTHWIRPQRPSSNYPLNDNGYAVGLDAALHQGRTIKASEVREQAGLWTSQALILALFGADDRLEKLWAMRTVLIPEIASAGYDLILAPSFSIYEGRPPSEWLLHTKRSYWFAAALQEAGAATIPRSGAWVERWQMQREAKHCIENPWLKTLALDVGTLSGRASWDRFLGLLSEFDICTGRRLLFVINGPSTVERVLSLYRLLTPTRVRLLSSRHAAYPALAPEVSRNVSRALAVWKEESQLAASTALPRAA